MILPYLKQNLEKYRISISSALSSEMIDVTGYATGNYIISLVCNNVVVDAANLIIN